MNILLTNIHSARNLGDEAIMRVTIRSLRQAFPGASITLATNDPASWQAFEGIEIVESLTRWFVHLVHGRWRARVLSAPMDLLWLAGCIGGFRLFRRTVLPRSSEKRRLLQAYFSADLVLGGGGGNLYAPRAFSPFFILALATLGVAIGLRKRVVLLPQSIGPIKGRIQRLIARITLGKVDRIMVREPRSLEFVTQILALEDRVVLVPDLAFDLSPARVKAASNAVKSSGLRIGVTLIDRAAQNRNFKRQEEYELALVTTLTMLAETYGFHAHIFAQCYGPSSDHDDRHAAQRVFRAVKQLSGVAVYRADFADAWEAREAYSHMDCFIATRMHSGIFALSAHVPTIVIGYEHKACAVMQMLGMDHLCCDIETVTADQLYELVGVILERRDELDQLLANRIGEIRRQLRLWTSNLQRLDETH